MALAEQCVKTNPQSARCHDALGIVYGAAALSGGLTSIFKYAGRVKEEFQRAVELDPMYFDARENLGQFYLQAPGIAGGSVRKARDNAEDMAKLDANRAALLRAEIQMYEKEWDQTEATLTGIKPGSDTVVADALMQLWLSLAFRLNADGDTDRAQKQFERIIAAESNNVMAHQGLGIVFLGRNEADAAIASFNRALAINSKARVHYRLGQAYMVKGDKPKALDAFQRFIAYQATGNAADDARKMIEQLKRG